MVSVCAAGLGTLACASSAHAEEPEWAGGYVSPGVVWSWTNDPVGSSGVSFEVSGGYNFLFTGEWYSPQVGGVFRYGSVDDGVNEGWDRGLIGAQGGIGPLGVELGFGWRERVPDVEPQRNGLVVAPYASAGFLFIGPEWFIPVGAGSEPELSLNFGLKVPVIQIVYGFQALGSAFGRVPSGRPLRIERQAVVADVACSVPAAWSVGARPGNDDVALTREERSRLAAHWLHEARGEHASIPSFAWLSLALTKHAAPPDLLRRTHRAALDEIDHAERCFALARRYADDAAIEPRALDAAGATLPDSLFELALDSLIDGWLGEGCAAAMARAASRRARDAQVRATLRAIAREEARHARLGLDIACWAAACARRGGHSIDAPLARAWREAVSRPVPVGGWASVSDREREHGLLSASDRERARRTAVARLSRIAARLWPASEPLPA